MAHRITAVTARTTHSASGGSIRPAAKMTKVTLLLALLVGTGIADAQQVGRDMRRHHGENLVLVTIDGVRWQEAFAGADSALLSEAEGVADVETLTERFWRDTAEARRETLMPFLWQVVARQGQIVGDRSAPGSEVRVQNLARVSYPGYNELLVGRADPSIVNNTQTPNRNVTVLEWLSGRPGFEGLVAAFGSWETFHFILERDHDGAESSFPVNAGWDPVRLPGSEKAAEVINQLQDAAFREWEGVRFDNFTWLAALEYLKTEQPRVLYLALGEPDDWAHLRRYDRYLDAIHRCDEMIAKLWRLVQSMPRYAGRTSLVVTVDHGRGRGTPGSDWTSHGIDVAGSEEAWIALLGPHTPASGVRYDLDAAPLTLSQTAATVAALVGEDWGAAAEEHGGAAPPIPGALVPPPGTSNGAP